MKLVAMMAVNLSVLITSGAGSPSAPRPAGQNPGQVLDTYHPAVLAVENEENSARFYTGPPEEYAAELKAARQVAHQHGTRCANGGLVSAPDFATRAFTPDRQRQLDSPAAREQIRKGKALLSAYRMQSASSPLKRESWGVNGGHALHRASLETTE